MKKNLLASGGLDSSILLADLARNALVFPIYVTMGLMWEKEEKIALEAFIKLTIPTYNK